MVKNVVKRYKPNQNLYEQNLDIRIVKLVEKDQINKITMSYKEDNRLLLRKDRR